MVSLGFLGLGLFCVIGQKAEGEEVKSKKGKVKREEGKGKREKEKGRGQGKSKFKMQNAKLRNPDVVGMAVLIGGWAAMTKGSAVIGDW